jgi:hypothetical protein
VLWRQVLAIAHAFYVTSTRIPNQKSTKTGEFTMKKNHWMRRVTAGVVLAAAPALIALGTAAAGHAAAVWPPPTVPVQTTSSHPVSNVPWFESSFHERHAAQIQSFYR